MAGWLPSGGKTRANEAVWIQVVEQLRKPWVDDDPVNPFLVSDLRYAGAPAEWVLQDVRTALAGSLPGAVFIADGTTMRETGHPLLAVSTKWDGKPFEEDEEEFVTQFRVLPDAVAEVSVNLDLGNMDFEEFAGDQPHERWVTRAPGPGTGRPRGLPAVIDL